MLLPAVLLLFVLCLGVWVYRLHAENLKIQEQSSAAWRELALKLADDQRDANSRLLIRSGISPAPKAEEARDLPALEPELTDTEWAMRDERDEIEERARAALYDPLQAELLEDAAKYDPMWAAVRDRYIELKRNVS